MTRDIYVWGSKKKMIFICLSYSAQDLYIVYQLSKLWYNTFKFAEYDTYMKYLYVK